MPSKTQLYGRGSRSTTNSSNREAPPTTHHHQPLTTNHQPPNQLLARPGPPPPRERGHRRNQFRRIDRLGQVHLEAEALRLRAVLGARVGGKRRRGEILRGPVHPPDALDHLV